MINRIFPITPQAQGGAIYLPLGVVGTYIANQYTLNDLVWQDILTPQTDGNTFLAQCRIDLSQPISKDGELQISLIPNNTPAGQEPVNPIRLRDVWLTLTGSPTPVNVIWDAISVEMPLTIPRGYKLAIRWHSGLTLDLVTVATTYFT